MNSSDLTRLAMAVGVLYGIYKFAPNEKVKVMVLAVAGVAIGKRVPVVGEVL